MVPPSSLDRRSVLRLGSALGLTMPQLLALEDPAPAADEVPAPAKAVIQVFLGGGLAAQESFDPKPYSPLAYRGEGKARPTRLDGIHFGEHLDVDDLVVDVEHRDWRVEPRGELDRDVHRVGALPRAAPRGANSWAEA